MRIECKKLRANIPHTTCVARQAKIEMIGSTKVVRGEGVDFKLFLCEGCKKGERLYKKALEKGFVYNPNRRILMQRTMIDVNRDYLKSKFMAGA